MDTGVSNTQGRQDRGGDVNPSIEGPLESRIAEDDPGHEIGIEDMVAGPSGLVVLDKRQGAPPRAVCQLAR